MTEAMLIDELTLWGLDRHGHIQQLKPGFPQYLAGAALIDLALVGRVAVIDGRLQLLDPAPTEHAALDFALRAAGRPKPAKPHRLIQVVARSIQGVELDHLAAVGVLRREKVPVFGIFSRERHVSASGGVPGLLQDARARIRAAVQERAPATERTAALCALVARLRWEKRVFPDPVDEPLRGRIRAVADGGWGADAIRRALDEITSAVVMVANMPGAS
jgi:hypothetical protein